jgi:competence protein ComEA
MVAIRLSLPVSAALLAAGAALAAFEPVALDPWSAGGYASCVFPRGPGASLSNPALLGLLEAPCASFSALRPFGLRELDRAAAGGSVPFGSFAIGGVLTASGTRAYSEFAFGLPVAWRGSDFLVLGLCPSVRRLAISGYGSATAFSACCGAVCRPLRGVYLSTGLDGLVRTNLGDSGDPAVPLSLSAGAGVCPTPNARLSVGVSRQEGLPVESSLALAFFPVERLGLEISFQSDPARFSASVCADLSDVEIALGYSEHPALGGTPSLGATWGLCAFAPDPVTEGTAPVPEERIPVMLNINQAGVEELCSLPGIGPAKAEAIIHWREANGPFRSVDQLADIPGISERLVESLRACLTVE